MSNKITGDYEKEIKDLMSVEERDLVSFSNTFDEKAKALTRKASKSGYSEIEKAVAIFVNEYSSKIRDELTRFQKRKVALDSKLLVITKEYERNKNDAAKQELQNLKEEIEDALKKNADKLEDLTLEIAENAQVMENQLIEDLNLQNSKVVKQLVRNERKSAINEWFSLRKELKLDDKKDRVKGLERQLEVLSSTGGNEELKREILMALAASKTFQFKKLQNLEKSIEEKVSSLDSAVLRNTLEQAKTYKKVYGPIEGFLKRASEAAAEKSKEAYFAVADKAGIGPLTLGNLTRLVATTSKGLTTVTKTAYGLAEAVALSRQAAKLKDSSLEEVDDQKYLSLGPSSNKDQDDESKVVRSPLAIRDVLNLEETEEFAAKREEKLAKANNQPKVEQKPKPKPQPLSLAVFPKTLVNKDQEDESKVVRSPLEGMTESSYRRQELQALNKIASTLTKAPKGYNSGLNLGDIFSKAASFVLGGTLLSKVWSALKKMVGVDLPWLNKGAKPPIPVPGKKGPVVGSKLPKQGNDSILSKTKSLAKGAGSIIKSIPILGSLAALGFTAYDQYTTRTDESLPEKERKETANSNLASAGGGFVGMAAGGAAGAALGTMVTPVIGTAIGGVVGSVAGLVAGEKVARLAYDSRNKLASKLDTLAKQADKTFGTSLSKVTADLGMSVAPVNEQQIEKPNSEKPLVIDRPVDQMLNEQQPKQSSARPTNSRPAKPQASSPIKLGSVQPERNKQSSTLKEVFTVGSGVDLTGVNPVVQNNLLAMGREYTSMTGKKLQINSAFRSRAKQEELRKRYGSRAAPPGRSLHEFGLAVDLQPAQVDTLASKGMLKKYGFERISGANERQHIQVAGSSIPARRAGLVSGDFMPEDKTGGSKPDMPVIAQSPESIKNTANSSVVPIKAKDEVQLARANSADSSVQQPTQRAVNKTTGSSQQQNTRVASQTTSQTQKISVSNFPTFAYNDGAFFAMNLGALG